MPLPPAGHTPDHVPLHTPGHVGGGAIAPTLGPKAAHGRGLVLTTDEEEGVRDRGTGRGRGIAIGKTRSIVCFPIFLPVVPTLPTLVGGTTTAGLPSQTGRDTMEIG